MEEISSAVEQLVREYQTKQGVTYFHTQDFSKVWKAGYDQADWSWMNNPGGKRNTNGDPISTPFISEILGYGFKADLCYAIDAIIEYGLLQILGVPAVLIAEKRIMQDYIDNLPEGTLILTKTEWENIVKYALRETNGDLLQAMKQFNGDENGAFLTILEKLKAKDVSSNLESTLLEKFPAFFSQYANIEMLNLMSDYVRHHQKLVSIINANLIK